MRAHPHLPLPLILALRTHLGRHRALSILTVLAIAGSVTLATGLEMSSRSVEVELENTARAVAGAAQLEVVGGTLGVRESLLDEVASVAGVRVAAPFVQATFRVDRPEAKGASIHVFGIDLLADASVRSYSGSAEVADPLRLISGSDSVIIGPELAEQLKLGSGDILPVRAGGKPFQLTVRGTLNSTGLAEAFGGQIAVMDVYTLQTLLGREGWLDRIDIVAEKGAAEDAVMAAVAAKVQGRATVRRSGARGGWLETALRTIRTVVLVLVVVAVLVASLISYSALSLFIDRRIPELALLRAAGLEPRRVRRLLYLDAALLAVAGTLIGGLLGRLLSETLLTGLSGISDFLQGVEMQRLEVRPSTLVTAGVVGGLVSFAGVFAPAFRATRRPPLAVLLNVNEEPGVRRRWTRLLPFAFLILAVLAAWAPEIPPLIRIAAAMVSGLLALEGFTRLWTPRVLHWLQRGLERVLPGIGRLAGASLVARPGQTALAVVCVAGVVAGVIMSLIVGQSTAHSLDELTASHYPNGVLVMAGRIVAENTDKLVSSETIQVIRETPGVRAVFAHSGETTVYRGEDVYLVAGNMSVLARFGRLSVVDGDPRAVAEAIATGAIVVSDGFSRHFGIGRGERVTLDTPKGPRSFGVAGVIRDFAGPAGSINIDTSIFDELWVRRGSRNIVFWPEGDPAPVISEIRRRVGESQSLLFVYGDDLAHFASGFLKEFQAIITSVALLTALLGAIAVWNLMLSAVTGRTRELALLLAVGATPGQVRMLTLIDGLVLGLCGGVVGIALGVLGGYVLVFHLLADALGWSLTFTVNARDFLVLLAGLIAASLLASLLPAWVASRVPMRTAFGPG